jgi:hypothetical protein
MSFGQIEQPSISYQARRRGVVLSSTTANQATPEDLTLAEKSLAYTAAVGG